MPSRGSVRLALQGVPQGDSAAAVRACVELGCNDAAELAHMLDGIAADAQEELRAMAAEDHNRFVALLSAASDQLPVVAQAHAELDRIAELLNGRVHEQEAQLGAMLAAVAAEARSAVQARVSAHCSVLADMLQRLERACVRERRAEELLLDAEMFYRVRVELAEAERCLRGRPDIFLPSDLPAAVGSGAAVLLPRLDEALALFLSSRLIGCSSADSGAFLSANATESGDAFKSTTNSTVSKFKEQWTLLWKRFALLFLRLERTSVLAETFYRIVVDPQLAMASKSAGSLHAHLSFLISDTCMGVLQTLSQRWFADSLLGAESGHLFGICVLLPAFAEHSTAALRSADAKAFMAAHKTAVQFLDVLSAQFGAEGAATCRAYLDAQWPYGRFIKSLKQHLTNTIHSADMANHDPQAFVNELLHNTLLRRFMVPQAKKRIQRLCLECLATVVQTLFCIADDLKSCSGALEKATAVVDSGRKFVQSDEYNSLFADSGCNAAFAAGIDRLEIVISEKRADLQQQVCKYLTTAAQSTPPNALIEAIESYDGGILTDDQRSRIFQTWNETCDRQRESLDNAVRVHAELRAAVPEETSDEPELALCEFDKQRFFAQERLAVLWNSNAADK